MTGLYLREMLLPLLAAEQLPRFGINSERLVRDDQYRVPLYQVCQLLNYMLAEYQDPLFCLSQSRGITLKAFPWLGASLFASVDLQTGLQRLAELEPLIWNGSSIELVQGQDKATLRWHMLPDLPAALVELSLSGWVILAPVLAQVPSAEVQLNFRHAARAPLADYEQILGCTPTFEQSEDSLVFPASWLQHPLTHSDPAAGEWLLQEARRRLAEGMTTWQLETRVRAYCLSALPGAMPEAADIAREFALTPRTLRCLLQAQAINLRELQDEVRRDAACWWLRVADVSLVDVAQGCGFSEQSAFQRAFRRWTGHTPMQWREDVAG